MCTENLQTWCNYAVSLKMARLSKETRRRVITLHSRGYRVLDIQRRLQEENISVSYQAIYDLIRKFREKGTVKDLPGRRRPRKITQEMRAVRSAWM